MVNSVVEEIDRIGEMFSPGQPVSIIGHSFGAMYAALYMNERLARVSQAMLIEPAGPDGDIMQETFEHLFAGHRVPVESPDELIAIARAYLDR